MVALDALQFTTLEEELQGFSSSAVAFRTLLETGPIEPGHGMKEPHW